MRSRWRRLDRERGAHVALGGGDVRVAVLVDARDDTNETAEVSVADDEGRARELATLEEEVQRWKEQARRKRERLTKSSPKKTSKKKNFEDGQQLFDI